MPDTKKNRNNQNKKAKNPEQISQTGKTPEEVLPYLLSGEPDDIIIDKENL